MAHSIFAERFLAVIDALDVTDYKLALQIGMLHPNLSRIRSGNAGVSLRVLSNLCAAYPNVSAEYLVTGRGSMFTQDAPAAPVYESDTQQGLIEVINRLQASVEEKDKRIEELTNRLLNLTQ